MKVEKLSATPQLGKLVFCDVFFSFFFTVFFTQDFVLVRISVFQHVIQTLVKN